MKRNSLLFFLLLSFLTASIDWPVYKGNLYFTGNNDELPPEGNEIRWTFQTKHKIYNPVVSEGIVYFTTVGKEIFAVDEESGRLIFKRTLDTPLTHPSVISGSDLITAGYQWLWCFNKTNGNTNWARKDFQNGIYTYPVLSGRTVYYSSRKNFFAKELRHGHDQWEPLDIPSFGGFACVDADRIYLPSKDIRSRQNYIYCLNRRDGRIIWKKALPYAVKTTAPVVYGTNVYITLNSNLYCLNTADGKEIYDRNYGDYIVTHPSFSDRSVVFSLRSGRTVIADMTDGKVLRSISPPFTGASHHVLIRDQLYIAGTRSIKSDGIERFESEVIGYDMTDGRSIWQWKAPEKYTTGNFIASRGRIIVPVGKMLYSIGREGDGWFPGGDLIARNDDGDSTDDDDAGTGSDPDGQGGTGDDDSGKDDLSRNQKKIPIIVRAYERETGKDLPATYQVITRIKGRIIDSFTISAGSGDKEVWVPATGETEVIASSDGYISGKEYVKDKKPGCRTDIPLDPIQKGRLVVINNIEFDFGKATLRPSSINLLDRLREDLRKNVSLMIEVRGHTDNVGSEEDNMKLSLKRADAVKEYLVKNGVHQYRVKTVGYGESSPIADNETEEGRSQNRRTEFFILDQ